MNLDEQIEWLEEECRSMFEPFNSEYVEVLDSLRELKRLRARVAELEQRSTHVIRRAMQLQTYDDPEMAADIDALIEMLKK